MLLGMLSGGRLGSLQHGCAAGQGRRLLRLHGAAIARSACPITLHHAGAWHYIVVRRPHLCLCGCRRGLNGRRRRGLGSRLALLLCRAA
jgi:hypothetical protein